MHEALQPPAILLEGPPGSGKTFSIATLPKAGIETFVIGTEGGYIESLLDAMHHYQAPLEKLHWHTVMPTAPGWDAINSMITSIGTSSYEDIQKIKSGVGKTETRKPAMEFLEALKDFRCERTGESFGDISSWGPDRALVVDSLSGLSSLAMALTIGYKAAAHQGEWGVAMNFLEQILLKLVNDRHCYFVLIAHVERETNELTGAQQIMASTLGRKLSPKIPRWFGDVILASRTKDQGFKWATIDNAADLKNRALPISDDLEPNFTAIVEAYNRRVKAARAQGPQPTPSQQPAGTASEATPATNV